MNKSRTLAEVNAELRDPSNTFEDFPVGTRVQVMCVSQDFHFFDGNELGLVVVNHGRYLGIVVQFDKPRHYKSSIQKTFCFNPEDLRRIDRPNYCKTCGQKLKYHE